MASQSALGSLTGTVTPVDPSITTSTNPPIRDAIVGIPHNKGSATPPQFSEFGTCATQSKSQIADATRSRLNAPGMTTALPDRFRAYSLSFSKYVESVPQGPPIKTPRMERSFSAASEIPSIRSSWHFSPALCMKYHLGAYM